MIHIFGYTQADLIKIYLDQGKDKKKYVQAIEKLDIMLSERVFSEVMDENTFVH